MGTWAAMRALKPSGSGLAAATRAYRPASVAVGATTVTRMRFPASSLAARLDRWSGDAYGGGQAKAGGDLGGYRCGPFAVDVGHPRVPAPVRAGEGHGPAESRGAARDEHGAPVEEPTAHRAVLARVAHRRAARPPSA